MPSANQALTDRNTERGQANEPVVYTVSDLHIGSYRSQWNRHKADLHAAADTANILVLNGDIFELPPLNHPDLPARCQDAINWLEAFCVQHPHCTFHLNLGNHDAVQPFKDQLEALAGRLPNLEWDEFFVRIGHAVFLHGDAAMTDMDLPALARERKLYERAAMSRLMTDAIYTVLHAMRIHHWLHHLVFPRQRTLRTLLRHLDAIGQGPAHGVRTVYFGHTHLHVDGIKLEGVRFYNGGAPIMGLQFKILRADCGVVHDVQPSRARDWLPAIA